MRDPKLTQHAKNMRKSMTPAEQKLWLELRAGRLRNIKFRRQKVIGDYIVDFAANAPQIIIEADGESHAHQPAYDVKRSNDLEQLGYHIMRFPNAEILGNIDGVLMRILEQISLLLPHPPLPTLSPKGERAL